MGVICLADAYTELSTQLKSAVDSYEIHRLKSQVASAAVQRLEDGGFSKTEQKKLQAEIRAHCADVQLGTMDVWYGESVVSWGRMLLYEGEWEEVRSVMLDQAEVLQNIEKNLKANRIPVSSISPVAGCRYVLGETYRIEFEEFQTLEPAVEALKHFYNVYIKYGDSLWGEKAQLKAEAMKEALESRGKQVRIDLGPHKDVFVANKFKLGERLIAAERYADAVEPIETALNYFPETGKSSPALINLFICSQQLGLNDEAAMIASYCAERFAADTNAPHALLRMGRYAVDSENENLGSICFELYLASFPEHENRADILSWFAWKAYKAADWEKVPPLFQALEAELRRLGEDGERLEKAVYIQAVHPPQPEKLDAFMAEFPESERTAAALSKKAQALLVEGNFDEAFLALETLQERFPNDPAAKRALAGLIVAAVEAGRFDTAAQVLDRMLEDSTAYGLDVYLSTGEGLLQAGQFELAARAFGAVPPHAPQAYVERAAVGTAACRFGTEDYSGSFQTLEKLLAQFPNTGRYYDARLMQARCLVQLQRVDEAVAAYAEAAAGMQDYAVTLEMADIMTNPEDRLSAYQRIALLADPARPENQVLIAQSITSSLPLCIELDKYELAISACDQFEELFPEHDELPAIGKFRKEAERALAN